MTMPSLDVLAALVTLYIVLALTVSAATEVVSRIFGLRSIGLKSGIRSILQDPNVKALEPLTKKFWLSGIIKSATDGDKSPGSLDALTFATATLSTVAQAAQALPKDLADAKTVLAKANLNTHLKSVLTDLAERAAYRGTTLHDELAQHFDATMEKIARWYRHFTQCIAFVLAAILTVYINANTLDLLHTLTAHPEQRLELAKIEQSLSSAQTTAVGSKAGENLSAAIKYINNDPLGGESREWSVRAIVGLLITILAVSLGAPFWFDVLGRITQKPAGASQPVSSVSTQPAPGGQP